MLEETRLDYALVTVVVEVWISIGSCRRLLLNDGLCGSYASKPERTITSGLPTTRPQPYLRTFTFHNAITGSHQVDTLKGYLWAENLEQFAGKIDSGPAVQCRQGAPPATERRQADVG